MIRDTKISHATQQLEQAQSEQMSKQSKKSLGFILFICSILVVAFLTFFIESLEAEKQRKHLHNQTQLNQIQYEIEIALEKEYTNLFWFINQMSMNQDNIFNYLPTLSNIILETSPHIEAIFWQEKNGKYFWSQLNPNIPNAELDITEGTNQIEHLLFNTRPKIQSSDLIFSQYGKAYVIYYFPVTLIKENGILGIKVDLISIFEQTTKNHLKSKFNLSATSNHMMFYRTSDTNIEQTVNETSIPHFHQNWILRLHPVINHTSFMTSQPFLILIIGLLLTGLIGIILYLFHIKKMNQQHQSMLVNQLISEIDKQQQTEEELNFSANYDKHTQLPNQNAIEEYIHKAISLNHDVILISISLDSYHEILSMHGSSIADQLLTEILKRFQDIISNQGILARTRPEQFMFACEKMSQLDAEMFANKLYLTLEKPLFIQNHDIHSSCSIGLTERYNSHLKADDLMHHVGLALYQAQKSVHNKIMTYNENIALKRSRQKSLSLSLKKAIENDELSLVFQPQIDIQTQKIRSIEVLLRWQNQKGESITPHVILNTAKETGLMSKLGHWTIKNALKQYSDLLDERCAPPFISINISNEEIQDNQLAEFLIAQIKHYDIPAKQVILEITEQTFLNTLEHNPYIINQIIQADIKIHLDQFGIGYSSFSHLKNIPIHAIKINPLLIKNLPISQDESDICNAIVSIANLFSIQVIADGVETEEEAAFANQIGCQYAQGYYYYHPLNKTDLMVVLKST